MPNQNLISSPPGDQTHVSMSPTLAGRCFTTSATWEAHMPLYTRPNPQNAQVTLEVRNLPANTGEVRDVGSTSGLGRCPGGGHGNPLQFSCLENLVDRGAWWATAYGYAKRWTWLKWLSMHRMHKTFSKQPIKKENLFWSADARQQTELPCHAL